MCNNSKRVYNIADIGDLVEIDGYYGDLFVVESWTREESHYPDLYSETICYDVTNVDTHESLIAYQEDVRVIERKKDAWAELDGLSAVLHPDYKHIASIYIDDKLTEISDYKTLINIFGDDDGEYQSKIDDTKAILSDVVGLINDEEGR